MKQLRNNIFVLLDTKSNTFHIADYLLGYVNGEAQWIDLGNKSLFEGVESELIRLNEASNVTEVSIKRQCGYVEDYRVTYNRAYKGNA